MQVYSQYIKNYMRNEFQNQSLYTEQSDGKQV